MYHQLKLLSMKGICTRITIVQCIHCGWHQVLSLFDSIEQWMFNYKHISIDCHYNKYEFFNLDLQNDYSQCKLGKSVACFYDGNWYIGKILEWFYQNQDCSIQFMKRNNLNLHWISDSHFTYCWKAFENLICVIDPHKQQAVVVDSTY